MVGYYIVVYDINEKRVAKVHKILREYLQWKQRSVFEGWLRDEELAELMRKLSSVINEEEDSVLLYRLPGDKVITSFHIGRPSDKSDNVI